MFCRCRQRDREKDDPRTLHFPVAMPGVDLHFLPASAAADAPDSPDGACAESGLEQMIGDFLAQNEAEEEDEEEEEPSRKKEFESMLQCAVSEIHMDLQAFGRRVDARLSEAAAQVAPLAEAFAKLQEENARLRVQQDTLVRQVEALCQAMGLTDPPFSSLAGEESSPSTHRETTSDSPNLPVIISPCASQTAASEGAHDTSSCSSAAGLQQDPPACTLEETPPRLHREAESQESGSASAEANTLETPAPSPVPHPPTFASLRSLSAPSLIASAAREDTVLLPSARKGRRVSLTCGIQVASSSSCSCLNGCC